MAQSPDKPFERLLYSRRDAARALSVHPMTLLRLEYEGKLTPVKLDPKKQLGKTFYRAADIHAIAQVDLAQRVRKLERVRIEARP